MALNFRPVSLVCLLAAVACVSSAQPSSQPGAAFAVLGLASGQTMRINALNLGSRVSTSTSSCEVTMRFLDAKGTVVKDSTATVVNGNSVMLDLEFDQASGSNRVPIRAMLLFGKAGGAAPGPDVRDQFDCNIVPSVEIYDSTTGRTSLVLTDSKPVVGPDPRSIAQIPAVTIPGKKMLLP